MKTVHQIIQESIAVKQLVLQDEKLIEEIHKIVRTLTDCFHAGGKLLICGNGGSAADAQHLAAEFSGRFYYDRKPLFAEALHANTSYMTAVANDYSYDVVYSRLVEGFGRQGDVLWGLSTSGNSPNIIKAIEVANSKGLTTIGFTGESGGKMKEICTHLVAIPSKDTPRIQESHITIGHIICEMVEANLFPR